MKRQSVRDFASSTPLFPFRHRRIKIVASLNFPCRFGLIVDAASEVMKIPETDVEAPPDVFEEGEVKYVTGVGKRKGKLVVLIDLTKILQKGELRRITEMVEAHAAAAL